MKNPEYLRIGNDLYKKTSKETRRDIFSKPIAVDTVVRVEQVNPQALSLVQRSIVKLPLWIQVDKGEVSISAKLYDRLTVLAEALVKYRAVFPELLRFKTETAYIDYFVSIITSLADHGGTCAKSEAKKITSYIMHSLNVFMLETGYERDIVPAISFCTQISKLAKYIRKHGPGYAAPQIRVYIPNLEPWRDHRISITKKVPKHVRPAMDTFYKNLLTEWVAPETNDKLLKREAPKEISGEDSSEVPKSADDDSTEPDSDKRSKRARWVEVGKKI